VLEGAGGALRQGAAGAGGLGEQRRGGCLERVLQGWLLPSGGMSPGDPTAAGSGAVDAAGCRR